MELRFGQGDKGDLMTLLDELFQEYLFVNAKTENDTGVTWEFAFTVTDEMREVARQRKPTPWPYK
jgi:hypothetical protein